jgi:hypothetical protein
VERSSEVTAQLEAEDWLVGSQVPQPDVGGVLGRGSICNCHGLAILASTHKGGWAITLLTVFLWAKSLRCSVRNVNQS